MLQEVRILDLRHGSCINKPTETEVDQNIQKAGIPTPDSSMEEMQSNTSNCSRLVARGLRNGNAWSRRESMKYLSRIKFSVYSPGLEAGPALARPSNLSRCTPIKQQIPLSGVGGQAPFWKLLSVRGYGSLSVGWHIWSHSLSKTSCFIFTSSSRVLSLPHSSLTTGQILLPMMPKSKQSVSNASIEVHCHTSKRLRCSVERCTVTANCRVNPSSLL